MMSKMVKACILSDSSSPGFWRLTLPFLHMIKHKTEDEYPISINLNIDQCKSADMLQADVVVVSRLHSQQHIDTITALKKMGKAVIYDLDDDLWQISPDNPAYFAYTKERLDNTKIMLDLVDVIVTTNDYLADSIAANTETPIVVIPNAIDIPSYQPTINKSRDGFKRVLWMGSQSHTADMATVSEAIEELLAADDKIKMVIVGSLPECIDDVFKEKPHRCEFNNFIKPVEKYIEFTTRLIADVAICPLVDSHFNCSKSNLKFLEYTAMHLPVVASNVRPYAESIVSGQSGIIADNGEDFYNGVTRLLNAKRTGRGMVKQARQFVQQHHNLNLTGSLWRKLCWALHKNR